jgi:hypothetical protein
MCLPYLPSRQRLLIYERSAKRDSVYLRATVAVQQINSEALQQPPDIRGASSLSQWLNKEDTLPESFMEISLQGNFKSLMCLCTSLCLFLRVYFCRTSCISLLFSVTLSVSVLRCLTSYKCYPLHLVTQRTYIQNEVSVNEYNNPSFATMFQRALLNTCITTCFGLNPSHHQVISYTEY